MDKLLDNKHTGDVVNSNNNLSRRYSNEFKKLIVSLHQTRRSANSLSKKYSVFISSVTPWIKQADPNDTNILSVNEKQLIKENKRLKAENDILKRAAFLLAKS